MLLEHTFVTTLDDARVIQQVEDLFVAVRFAREPGEPLHRQYHNGRGNAGKAKKIPDLPMRVWVNCDRGRISLAASIEESRRFRKEKNLLRDRLLMLAAACERVLKDGEPLGIALARWHEQEQYFEQQERRKKRRDRIILAVVLTLVFGAVAALIVVAQLE